ncbi:uncharacterized protein LOC130883551 [Chionomys nivalis]|uniref:uncharacterized protein LOC130883551 n=1 Tax=Chionomys nivalis TaxID=269649 RepID=UPI0025951ADF|nr:uncharacterized protein LOC130883551 [Chionomys nivalis]
MAAYPAQSLTQHAAPYLELAAFVVHCGLWSCCLPLLRDLQHGLVDSANHDKLNRSRPPEKVLNFQPLSPASVGPSYKFNLVAGRTTARDPDTAVTSDAAVASARLRRRRSVGSGALTHEEQEGERPGGQDARRRLENRGGAGASLGSAGGGCSARPPRIPLQPRPGSAAPARPPPGSGLQDSGLQDLALALGPSGAPDNAASCPGVLAPPRCPDPGPHGAAGLSQIPRHVIGAEDQQCDRGEGGWASSPLQRDSDLARLERSATSLFILSCHEQTRVQKNAFQSQRGRG